MTWFHEVTGDISRLPDALEYFEAEYLAASREVRLLGRIEKQSSDIPAIVEQRFSQLQEIEAILENLNLELRRIKTRHFKKYLESYNRALSSRDAEKYADGEDEVLDHEALINEVALMRNKWLGIIKSLDSKQFQLNNITKLRCAGLDDASI
jgi:hypothetical protein